MREWSPSVLPYRRIRPSRSRHLDLSPPVVLAWGFIGLILVGTCLLKLPVSTTAPLTWMQALFTATSAVTVTGLVVVDTGSHFTVTGQVMIALLIQAGGLGFMTFAVVAAHSLGVRIGLNQRVLAKEAMNQTSLARVTQTAQAVLGYSLVIEAVGALLLWLVWKEPLGAGRAAFEAVFYTVSAFNNAGFGLAPDSLSAYAANPAVNLLITGLFIIGGIGFAILIDLRQNRRWSRLSPNTRLILKVTLLINLVAFLLIWWLEAGNPATLGGKPPGEQMLAAWFQAVTPRTAGFNTLPVDQLTNASSVLTLLLMYIGGGSMSTAGGIKLGTFIVLIMATYAFLRRRDEVTVARRTIAPQQVMKALALALISMVLIFLAVFVLAAIAPQAELMDIAFEVISALSTVGLSRGLTGELGTAGEAVIIFLMYSGRLGPLTLAYFLATPKKKRIRYPKTEIQVG